MSGLHAAPLHKADSGAENHSQLHSQSRSSFAGSPPSQRLQLLHRLREGTGTDAVEEFTPHLFHLQCTPSEFMPCDSLGRNLPCMRIHLLEDERRVNCVATQ